MKNINLHNCPWNGEKIMVTFVKEYLRTRSRGKLQSISVISKTILKSSWFRHNLVHTY